MQVTALCQNRPELERIRRVASRKPEEHSPIRKAFFLKVKLTAFILLIACLQVSANGTAQVTFSGKDVPLEKVFEAIRKQTGYAFLYNSDEIKKAKPVSIDVKNMPVEEVLIVCLKDQPLTFNIEQKTIFILPRHHEQKSVHSVPVMREFEVRGIVTNEDSQPIDGASVMVKGTRKGSYTNSKGEFVLTNLEENAVLTVSSIGYEPKTVTLEGNDRINVALSVAVRGLDQLVVVGYGNTSQRYNVGSVSKVTSEDISKQVINNPLESLAGRVPGLIVNSTSGIPGSSFKIQIRGQNTINPNPANANIPPVDNPLFIIDGVPFAPQNGNLNQFQSLASPGISELFNNPYGGLSPFANINPADIESIEVLRDADATAIYGSRGANGVILITTKRGRPGKTKFSLNAYSGASRVTRTMEMMNTEEYLMMRKEAYQNDGGMPNTDPYSSDFAPDILVYDSTKSTDWKKYFLGGTAKVTNVNLSLSGGSKFTQFMIGAGYSFESFIFPGDFSNRRLSLNSNIRHSSEDQRLLVDLSAIYSYSRNNSAGAPEALLAYVLPPNHPDLFDESGNLVWNYNGVDIYDNPLSYLKRKYFSNSYNLLSNLRLEYKLFENLKARVSLGYNSLNGDENSQNPKLSQNPLDIPVSNSAFGKNNFQSWIVEPQLEYSISVLTGRILTLVGFTYQNNTNSQSQIIGIGYPNDNLLGSISGATSTTSTDGYSQYKYSGLFARVNYVLADKYILSLNGRRDGSSRFGPGKQYGNFGSIGMGWLFGKEKFIENNLSFISYGKLRASYGTTGSDAIGNYQYLSRWGMTRYPYQGSSAYFPRNLFNEDLAWAETKKFEAGIELGFLNDKYLVSITRYKNRSGNQLVTYTLPSQTGFTGVTANFPALVENSGWEMQLTAVPIKSKNFEWRTAFNLTFPKNVLVSFPGIENTSYNNRYIVGQSLSVLRKFRFIGVNSSTGLYEFQTQNGPSGGPSVNDDLHVIGDLDPTYYGGLTNVLRFKNFQIDVLLQFAKQIGQNFLKQAFEYGSPGAYQYGVMSNQPIAIVDRWKKPGDVSENQKLTSQLFGTEASDAGNDFANSSGAYGDASYVRVKSVSFSYNLQGLFSKIRNKPTCRVYLNAQNLFTITNYKGNDPETQSFYSIPPLRSVVLGLQFNL